jgi:hypothetical protein
MNKINQKKAVLLKINNASIVDQVEETKYSSTFTKEEEVKKGHSLLYIFMNIALGFGLLFLAFQLTVNLKEEVAKKIEEKAALEKIEIKKEINEKYIFAEAIETQLKNHRKEKEEMDQMKKNVDSTLKTIKIKYESGKDVIYNE